MRGARPPRRNLLHVAPVRNAAGAVAYFVGVQLGSAVPLPGSASAPVPISNGAPSPRTLSRCPSSPSSPYSCSPSSFANKLHHTGVTGAVRVAVRSLGGCAGGLRRSSEDQRLPGSCSRASSGPGRVQGHATRHGVAPGRLSVDHAFSGPGRLHSSHISGHASAYSGPAEGGAGGAGAQGGEQQHADGLCAALPGGA